ncbi:Allograft inflammatory factor 1-like [Acipenser ruthenus]|uniref:Allograft inflammatory factor 1-like n=1 Tax=Acipenser ruthenus TaxID=7906 RepID=A0A444V4M5_ACIRT|nr:Allograft inflammatory factor 1-like [Acipenser ruthenus]
MFILSPAEDLEMRQKQEAELSAFNKEFLADLPFLNIPDLRGKLERLKWKFIEHDPQHSGEIDLLVLGCVVQELRPPRTQAELTALVQDLTGNHGNNIPYRDFVMVMLGRRSSMCARDRGKRRAREESQSACNWKRRRGESECMQLEEERRKGEEECMQLEEERRGGE